VPVANPRASVTIVAKPATLTTSRSAAISFTTIGVTSLTCSLDGGKSFPCRSPVSYQNLAVGRHSFAVTASAKGGSATATTQWQVSASTNPTVVPLGVPGNWTLRFDDEFNGNSLDLTKWQPNWLAGNDTAVTPPDNSSDLNCDDPRQVSESGGVLNITAVARSCRAANGHTYAYASGLVNTHASFRFTYGYAEARMNVPATANGTLADFPAFWANGQSWPADGELDVMEVLGTCGTVSGIGFHFHSSLGAFGGCGPALTPGWHTFGADWQPGVVTYYYDGQQVGQVTTGITGMPMYLILDNSVDPTWGGPTLAPADLQVDYVRVWQ
jgi:beta-glucanase (GH16 family)